MAAGGARCGHHADSSDGTLGWLGKWLVCAVRRRRMTRVRTLRARGQGCEEQGGSRECVQTLRA